MWYIAGDFVTDKGRRISVLKSDTKKWNLIGSVPENNSISSMCFSNENLYIGGYFSEIQSISSSYIAKWDGNKWTPLGSGVSGTVESILPCENLLVVIGNFSMAGGLSSNRTAFWNETTVFEKEKTSDLINKTREKANARDYTGALADITTAIEMDPQNPEYYVFRGIIYVDLIDETIEKGNGQNRWTYIKNAIKDFNMALNFQPDNFSAFYNRGMMGYIIESKINANRRGELFTYPSDPYKDFERASIIDPENPSPYYYLGLLNNLKTDPPAVTATFFLDAIKYSKDNGITANANYNLAKYYFNKQLYTEVIKYVSESIKLYPNFFWSRRLQGISKYLINDLDGAMLDFNWMIDEYPKDKNVAEIYRLRAKTLFKKSGNYKSACPDMKKASELGDSFRLRF